MDPANPPAPDFSDPLGLLRACHGRIQHFAGMARQLADYPLAPPEERVRQAATRIRRYFDQAAPLHHADEERDLLPLLAPHAGGHGPLRVLVDGLQAEHAELDQRWGELQPLLVELADGRAVAPAAYAAAAEAFEAAMSDHVARENAHLLPAAEAHLTAPDLQALGAAMARRRGVGQNKDG